MIEGLSMPTKFIAGTAAFGVVAGLWNHIKALFYKCYSLLVITMTVEGNASYALSMYLVRNFKRSRIGDIQVQGFNEYIRPLKCNQLVALKCIPSKDTVWWRGWRCVTVKRNWSDLTVRYIRGVFNCDELIKAAIDCFNAEKLGSEDTDNNRFFIRRKQGTVGDKLAGMFSKKTGDSADETSDSSGSTDRNASDIDKYTGELIGWEFDEIGQPYSADAMDMLCLGAEAQEAYEMAVRWRDNETWFKQHGIPWKLGFHCHSRPGNGKTAFARALGQTLNMPLLMFDLSTMTNKDLVEAWHEALDWSPCIILYEEVHAVFHGTENVANTGHEAGLTFDCFLNIIDGVENSEGILTIITTNHPELLDAAIGGGPAGERCTRPGRIDRIVEFVDLDEENRWKMARRILCDFPEAEWSHLVHERDGVTGAQFQGICSQVALDMRDAEIAKG